MTYGERERVREEKNCTAKEGNGETERFVFADADHNHRQRGRAIIGEFLQFKLFKRGKHCAAGCVHQV